MNSFNKYMNEANINQAVMDIGDREIKNLKGVIEDKDVYIEGLKMKYDKLQKKYYDLKYVKYNSCQ